MKKYRVNLVCALSGKPKKKVVSALPVKIAGFEFLDLFMYQFDGTFCLLNDDRSPSEMEGKFCITENKRGYYISYGDDPESVYYEASLKLNEKGIDTVTESIAQAVL